MPETIRMDLDAAARLVATTSAAAEALDEERLRLVPVLGSAAGLLERRLAPSIVLVLSTLSRRLRADADELSWRRRYLATHAPRFPGQGRVTGILPRRRPHPAGDLGDGPFSVALGGLGPSAAELRALDHMATADLDEFLVLRQAAEAAASPFDWTAGGTLVWGACSGPIPGSAEDACLRHDFIYRNWRRLRDDFLLDPGAGASLKSYADDRLGDDVHRAVKRDPWTYLNPVNAVTGGLPVLPFLWSESAEPAVATLGEQAWNRAADPPAAPLSGDFYGEVAPPAEPVDPARLADLSDWLCPDELCT